MFCMRAVYLVVNELLDCKLDWPGEYDAIIFGDISVAASMFINVASWVIIIWNEGKGPP